MNKKCDEADLAFYKPWTLFWILDESKIGCYYYTHQKRCRELRYKLGRGYNIKYVLKIRIRVRTTTNISDDISTHIVFGVVQLNIIRVIHTIKIHKKYMHDGRKNGGHETQEKKNMIKHIATVNKQCCFS